MPAGRMEAVQNKPLTGDELRQLILRDVDRMLSNYSLLSPHMGYGRVGYEIIVRLHMDNAFHPTDEARMVSKPDPTEPSLATPPLANAPDALASAARLTRSVFSPNVERVREGLPVTATHREQDGTIATTQIKYPPDPTLEDTAQRDDAPAIAEMQRDWKLQPVAPPPAPEV